MSRALLALVLAFSLGNPAVHSWMGTLVQLASDFGNQWDSDGAGAEPDAGNHWDPDG